MPDSTMLQSKDLQERYERYKAKIKNFTIMNDIFMRNVLKKKECTEYILQVIMEDKGITVIDQTLQKDYKNLQRRSAILDCVAKDTSNRQFNVEIQGDNEGEQSGVQKGIQKGELKKARETVFALLEMGMPLEQITKAVKIPLTTVQSWIAETKF